MHTAAGTVWKGIETQLDETHLRLPSISLVASQHFLVDGTSALAPSRIFILSFGNTESVCVYDETLYWMFAREERRPQHVLNLILGTELFSQVTTLWSDDSYFHFLLCGADACAEVVARCYAIKEFPTRERAEQALAAEIDRTTAGYKLGLPEWLAPEAL